MPVLAAPSMTVSPALGIYRIVGENDEATSTGQYSERVRQNLLEFYASASLRNKTLFTDARQRLEAAAHLPRNWDTYGAEPPNRLALALASRLFYFLERASVPPNRVAPSAEGGVAFSFVERASRAVIEVYNTGEVAAATYSDTGQPTVWGLEIAEPSLQDTISRIRVHLAT